MSVEKRTGSRADDEDEPAAKRQKKTTDENKTMDEKEKNAPIAHAPRERELVLTPREHAEQDLVAHLKHYVCAIPPLLRLVAGYVVPFISDYIYVDDDNRYTHISDTNQQRTIAARGTGQTGIVRVAAACPSWQNLRSEHCIGANALVLFYGQWPEGYMAPCRELSLDSRSQGLTPLAITRSLESVPVDDLHRALRMTDGPSPPSRALIRAIWIYLERKSLIRTDAMGSPRCPLFYQCQCFLPSYIPHRLPDPVPQMIASKIDGLS